MSARRWMGLILIGACAMSSSCGDADESLRLAVTPAPIRLASTYISCAGVFAYLPCQPYTLLHAQWTVTVYSEADSAAEGVLEVALVDHATGAPPLDTGTVRGDLRFVVAPHGSVDLSVSWSGRSLPEAPEFKLTVRVTYTTGDQVVKLVTVPAAVAPR